MKKELSIANNERERLQMELDQQVVDSQPSARNVLVAREPQHERLQFSTTPDMHKPSAARHVHLASCATLVIAECHIPIKY